MAKWRFDMQQYEQDKLGFLHGIREMMDEFFGQHSQIQIPTLDAALNPLKEYVRFEDKSLLERFLDAVPDLVVDGRWDTASIPEPGELWEAQLAACLHLASSEDGVAYFALNHGWEYHISPDFLRILQIVNARCTLELEGELQPLDVQQLSLLANMDERSVRNALRTEFGPDMLNLSSEQARSWLEGRRGYIPTQFFNSQRGFQRLEEVKTLPALLQMVVWEAENLGIAEEELNALTGGLRQDGYLILPEDEQFISDPKRLVALAERLQWNPAWLAKTMMSFAMAYELAERESQLKDQMADAIEALGYSMRLSDSAKLTDPSELATAENIRACLSIYPGVSRHLKDKGGNAKVDVYTARNQRVIAHEHNLKTQSLWVETAGIHPATMGCTYSETNGASHSGFAKYPELAGKCLLRFHPSTIADVRTVLDAVIEARSLAFDEDNDNQAIH